MANLMTQSTSMDKLKKKYQDFLVPAAKVRVNGKDVVSDLKIGIVSISVHLELEQSNSASFTLVHVYDQEKRSFSSSAKSNICVGSIVEIELGYGSSLETVFYGFIYSARYTVGSECEIAVTAMDLRRLMMDNQKSYYTYAKNKASDVFQEIIKRYKPLYSKLELQTTSAVEDKTFEQNETDYSFVGKLCRDYNRQFFVVGSTVYFQEPQSKSTPILTFENQNSLYQFSREVLYKDITVVVQTRSGTKEVISKEKTFQTDSAVMKKLNIPVTRTIVVGHRQTVEQIQARVLQETAELARQSQTGEGSCVGLPDLVPSRCIKIKKMDSALDGTFYLKTVEHQFGSDGFETSFTVGGYQ